MSSCEWELQKAVYARIMGSSEVMAMVTGVYDHVPQGTEFPYVVLQMVGSSDYSNIAEAITQVRMVLVVYTRERGSKTALSIMAEIKALLHQAIFAVEGYVLHSCYFVDSELQQLSDGVTYRGNMGFKAFLEG